ncbi:EF-P lysine aminoacylase EpmA [Porticoccus sp. W117]|uniref:EF-P lysine aminoacylase EpmA n=1 Tax=Porticoccus sp. W117 TaxID=3054777 RepID=UPI002598F2D9|nr:EF-P lysine aminoacylase EpmA [Porticoccus sp. W117]MDM3872442.1 EF-P lysine aminoacylase EpmA [Porticoccus sp. W117]
MNWQPSASTETLRARAHLLAQIRQFFHQRNAFEVDVPVLGVTGVTDLHIDSIAAQCNGGEFFLQSSPEYFMKRLLAAGSGDIYCLGKAFRDGEAGSRHNPEFTLLEWYRVGWDEHRLMEEVAELLRHLLPDSLPLHKFSYGELFLQHTGLNPHTVALQNLQTLAGEVTGNPAFNEPRSTCLDAIFSFAIEPKLPDGLVLVYDYPQCQAALARIQPDNNGQPVARRFEAFLNGMELANGYWELTCPKEQARRFEDDRQQRRTAGKAEIEADGKLLAAMQSGMPECAGVALGVDRLLMQLLGEQSIEAVMAFPLSQV